MSEPGSIAIRVENLKSPDETLRDEAARLICQRYSSRLRSLVRRRLDNRVRRREDEDDILQTSYASFFASQRDGRPTPADRDEVWRLLVRITLCKLINTANRHTAARRDVRRENPPPRHRLNARSDFLDPGIDRVPGSTPPPEDRLVLAEEFDRLLRDLPEEMRQIVAWKLQGYTSAEIAGFIGRTVRMVELKMQLIRKRLETQDWAAARESSESA